MVPGILILLAVAVAILANSKRPTPVRLPVRIDKSRRR